MNALKGAAQHNVARTDKAFSSLRSPVQRAIPKRARLTCRAAIAAPVCCALLSHPDSARIARPIVTVSPSNCCSDSRDWENVLTLHERDVF